MPTSPSNFELRISSFFPRLILRPLFKEPGRTLLTVLGVTLGVAVMLGIQLANRGSLGGFAAALDAVSGKAALEITSPPLGVDERLLAEMTWLRAYGTAAPVVEADVLAVTGARQEMLRVIGVDALRDPALRDYALQGTQAASGMDLMRFLGQPDTLLLTRGFADKHGLKTGDTLTLLVGDRRRDCEVSAILGGSGEKSALSAQALAIMDIANAQLVLDKPGRLDRIELRLRAGLDVAQAEQDVRARLPEGLTLSRPQRRTAAVEKMLAAFHFNLTMLSGIALLVGLFLIHNTLSVAVMTRRREIGMWRTLGMTRGQVMRLFLGEALLLSVVGALIGVPLAKALAAGAIALTSTTVDTLYVATAARVPELEAWHWLAALGIAVPLALFAAALPAREAARVAPVEAMRGEAGGILPGGQRQAAAPRFFLVLLLGAAGYVAARQPAVNGLPLWGYGTCLCAIAAMALGVRPVLAGTARALRGTLGRVFGIEGRLAASQIRASTRRLSVSVAALAVSLALTVAIAVMVGSFRQTVLLWVDQSMGADLYARPGTPARSQGAPTLSQETLDLLTGHPAVAAADGYRAMDLPYQGRIVKLGTGDFSVQVEHGRMVFKTPGDPKALLQRAQAQGQVFISESFALRFGVREGGSVELTTPQGPRAFTVAGQFYDYSSDGGTLTMDQALFEKHFGASRPTHLALYLQPGSDAGAVREEMQTRLEGRGFVSIFTNAGLRAEVLRIFDGTFAITWALEIIAVLVAMAGVAATMLTLVLERREELRLLRLAGAEAGQVRRTILIESGLIGAVSQGLGLAVGVLLSLVLIHVINPQSFGWSIQFHTPWAFLLGSTVLTVLCTMLAGLWPARRAVKKLALGGMAVLFLGAGPGTSLAAGGPAFQAAGSGTSAFNGPVDTSKGRISPPMSTLAGSKSTLAAPKSRLASPKSRLAGSKSRLASPKSRLAGSKSRLAAPMSRLASPMSRLAGPMSIFANLKNIFVSFKNIFASFMNTLPDTEKPLKYAQEARPEVVPPAGGGFEQAGAEGGGGAVPAAQSSGTTALAWQPALAGYRFEFPRDHAQHPQHKIEWWYFTGNLDTREGRRFGYQLTFFRIGAVTQPAVQSPWALRDVWMAHLAVTDAQGRAYHHADRLNRAGPGLAGSTQERVWNEDWQCLFGQGGMKLRAAEGAFGLELELEKSKPPVFHGRDGISQKGPTPGNASHYYSFTRLPTRGTVTVDGTRHEVTGLSWMDHEFGSSFLEKGTAGWDWFSAQLDDGSELMLFQLRGENGGATTGSAGTFIHPDGTAEALAADDLRLTPGSVWRSPAGARYPIGWSLEVPRLALRLESAAVLPQQEFQAAATPGLGYWEGAVDYQGTRAGQAVRGRGYLEMTGYSGRSMSLWFGGEEGEK